MNLLPVIYFMLIFSLMSTGLNLQIAERARSLIPDRVQNTIVQLALAQHRHISDPANNPWMGTYAADIATLETRGYLPVWEADTAFSFVDTTPPGFSIRYQAEDNAEAGRIAARLGAIARVSDNVVTVGFADPTDLALLDTFLELAGGAGPGDEMTGPLHFAADIGDAINLNQNSLTDILNLSARNATNTGTVTANIIIGDTATFNDININP